jgi:flagellar protein FlaG
MLIQNIGSAASAPGLTSNSGPASVAVPGTQAAPVELPQQQAAQPTAAQLKNAVDSINRAMKQNNSNVEFSLEKGSKQAVVKVVDTETGQLISQFPSKQVVAMSQMIGESQPGALVKQQA